ncbi:MAG: DUF4157 domain-containing protein [Xenococcaceae cyanobacterium MO_188.B29]|nr:DUF4157 domain-containing protein [Xenococcaceae cyanobacterium MO_188.B29]
MSFDYKVEKPLLNSSLISTSSNLQTKSRLRDNSPEKLSDSKLSTPNLQARAKLTQYGHNLSKIAISYHQPSIQTKLTIGQPGDKYEQEADKVSDQVMNMSQPVQRQETAEEEMQMKPEIQRQEKEEEEKEEETAQAKPLANAITPLVQRQETPEEEEEMQMKPEIQRQEKEEEEELQTKSSGNSSTANMEGLEQQLSNSQGGGSSLSDEARSFMEPRFGTDFSNVKVHTDSSAVQMNQSIQAQAFTHGQDIYFNSGKYSPDTNEGKSLLAHELTHVVQQRGGD